MPVYQMSEIAVEKKAVLLVLLSTSVDLLYDFVNFNFVFISNAN